jgi:hypothetical protein
MLACCHWATSTNKMCQCPIAKVHWLGGNTDNQPFALREQDKVDWGLHQGSVGWAVCAGALWISNVLLVSCRAHLLQTDLLYAASW